MRVGTVREIKDHEYPFSLTSRSVQDQALHDHRALAKSKAGKGALHSCAADMPGAAARTNSHALINLTISHAPGIASLGLTEAIGSTPHLRGHDCKITYRSVADEFDACCSPPGPCLA